MQGRILGVNLSDEASVICVPLCTKTHRTTF